MTWLKNLFEYIKCPSCFRDDLTNISFDEKSYQTFLYYRCCKLQLFYKYYNTYPSELNSYSIFISDGGEISGTNTCIFSHPKEYRKYKLSNEDYVDKDFVIYGYEMDCNDFIRDYFIEDINDCRNHYEVYNVFRNFLNVIHLQ